MTTPTDETESLRTHLRGIREWCEAEILSGFHDPAVNEALQAVSKMAMRGLKTPRASKTLTVGEIMEGHP